MLIHLAVIAGLIRAFAPDFTDQMLNDVGAALNVTVVTPSPTPTPVPTQSPSEQPRKAAIEPEDEGAAAPPGKKAVPKEVVAPPPRIVLADVPAPKATSTGNDVTSGARDEGDGTGAGGAGQGTGSGGSGDGAGGGGGVAVKAVKIAGQINSAKDFPRASRDLRIGESVVIVLTVGVDGRVRNCSIHRPSRDPAADRITCQLATKRFRFRPARDAAGNPVESEFGWQQRWFYTGER